MNLQETFFLQLFTALDKSERRAFQKFVASPFFNGRPQLSPFLDYFVKTNEPSAEAAFQAAFPKEKFDVVKFRLTLSQLYKLAERFLAHQEIAQKATFPDLALAISYRKKGLDKHFHRTLKNIEKKQQAHQVQSAEFYEEEYIIEWEKYQFMSSGRRTEEFNLQAISDKMDVAFISRKLRHACFSLSHQAVYKKEYKIGLLPEIIKQVESSPHLLALPAIQLYYYCFLALTEKEGEKHFADFQKSLFEIGNQLPENEQRNLFLLAINYGIRKINDGQAQYDRPVLELYRMALENNLMLQNNRLSHFAFNNIVAIGVRIGETDWVEKFIHEYKKSLERKHRNVAVSLGLARLEYARKNYGEALLFLQKSDYKDFINNIIAKTLQLKIYFETEEIEVLEAHLRNMKNYIRRKRAFGYHRENYLNIIKFTQSLIELNPFDKNEKQKIAGEIKNTEPLTERKWLLNNLNV